MSSFRRIPGIVGMALLLFGCQAGQQGGSTLLVVGSEADFELAAHRVQTLGVGDKIHLTVFGEETLSGDFIVDASGQVVLPLIGARKAAGLPTEVLAAEIRASLDGPYLVDPDVSVTVAEYRPIYVLGEVTRPGEYPYRSGLSVISAVAAAQGYTYRANRTKVTIDRADRTERLEAPATANVPVLPGDIITVPERWF